MAVEESFRFLYSLLTGCEVIGVDYTAKSVDSTTIHGMFCLLDGDTRSFLTLLTNTTDVSRVPVLRDPTLLRESGTVDVMMVIHYNLISFDKCSIGTNIIEVLLLHCTSLFVNLF